MDVWPWDLFVLLTVAMELVAVRWLMHRAFHRGYRAAKEVYSLQRDDGYWDRQRALAREPKKA